jgi:hypothetical protein
MRFEQPVSCCHDGLAMYLEQPLPAPSQAVSLQPRLFEAGVSELPPTAVTCCDEAGYSTP